MRYEQMHFEAEGWSTIAKRWATFEDNTLRYNTIERSFIPRSWPEFLTRLTSFIEKNVWPHIKHYVIIATIALIGLFISICLLKAMLFNLLKSMLCCLFCCPCRCIYNHYYRTAVRVSPSLNKEDAKYQVKDSTPPDDASRVKDPTPPEERV